MSDFLFVYGTLLPGATPAGMAGAAAQLLFTGEGSVRGRLYDLGDFPGAILDDASASRIFGAVFALTDDPALLRALDDYEEFDPCAPQRSQFLRTRSTAELAAGGALECWIYVYNGEVHEKQLIPSGTWRRRSASSA